MTYANNHRSVPHLRPVPLRIDAASLVRQMKTALDRRGFAIVEKSPPAFPAPNKKSLRLVPRAIVPETTQPRRM